jgi:hypothetical protein
VKPFGSDANIVKEDLLTQLEDGETADQNNHVVSLEVQDDSEIEPPSKRDWFLSPKSSPERKKAAVGVIPKNTDNSTQWALQNFNSWATNRVSLGHPVPESLLRC